MPKKHPDWIRPDVWKRPPIAVVNGKKIWEISVDGTGWKAFVDEEGNHYEEIPQKVKYRLIKEQLRRW
jgi:hypothetical protein